jgi:hypothetical protein
MLTNEQRTEFIEQQLADVESLIDAIRHHRQEHEIDLCAGTIGQAVTRLQAVQALTLSNW